MSLVLSLLVAAPIILIVCGQSSDQPYMLGVANRAQGSNSVNLQCKNHVGVQVPGASFYRNSQQITNSSCLTAYPTGISSELNLTLVSQECDGYFSCGVNGTLSEPKPLYACPRTNVSADRRTEVIEEGTNFLLTCDFPPSPITKYRTVWYKGHGSSRKVIQNTPELQSYTLLSAQPDEYFCQVQPPTDKCYTFLYYNFFIEIQVKERYEPPMITKDLNYTQYTNGDGVFSVSTSGTNLTHKWYKNDKLINSTGAGILEIGNDFVRVEESNGLLRITYETSNVDYDNMTQTTQQTFGLYTNMTATCDQPGSVSTALAVSLGILSLISVSLTVACIILSILLCLTCRKTNKKPTENRDDKQTSNYMNQNPNSNQNTGGTTPNSTPDGDTKSIHLCEQSDRALRYHCDEMPSCKNNCDFLHCLTLILTAANGHKKFKNECSSLFSDLRRQIEEHMKKIEPKEKDCKGVVSDGQSCNAYKECEEMVKILKDLASDE